MIIKPEYSEMHIIFNNKESATIPVNTFCLDEERDELMIGIPKECIYQFSTLDTFYIKKEDEA